MDSKSGIEEPEPENNKPETKSDLPADSKDNEPTGRPVVVENAGADNTDTGDTAAVSFSLNRSDRLHRLFNATLSAEPAFESIREKIKKQKVNKILFGAWDIIGKMEPGKESKTSKVPGMVREVRERLDKIHGEIIRISKPLKLRDSLKKSSKKLSCHQPPEEEFRIIPVSSLDDSQVIGEDEEIEKKVAASDPEHRNGSQQGEGSPEVY